MATSAEPIFKRGPSEAGSPIWWLRRLHMGIMARHWSLNRLQRYYDGEFSLHYADERLRQAFGDVFYADRFGINWMRIVVGAVEERLHVEGIRVGGGQENDDTAWDIWQTADLDELSSTAHLEALVNGIVYVTCWPGEDPEHPDITIEHPAQAIVETDPRNPRRRLAGLRMYVDSEGYLHAELFLPNEVHLFRSTAGRDTSWDPQRMTWVYDTEVPSAEVGMMDNPWGLVPIVPIENLARLSWNEATVARDVQKRSEMWTVMPIQDAINSVLFNTLLVANQQGFRQRWVTGLTLEVDKQGRPIQPFKSGVDRLLVAEDVNTKFGDLPPSDVTHLVALMDQLVHAVGAVSQVPPHYFSAHADRLSGESIKAAESGLVSKVRRKMVSFGGSWETVMRLAGLMTGNEALAEARGAAMIWGNPETRSEAQVADSALKMSQVGVPWRQVMEHLGYSPDAISAMELQRQADALTKALSAPLVVNTPPSVTAGAPVLDQPPPNGGQPTPASGSVG